MDTEMDSSTLTETQDQSLSAQQFAEDVPLGTEGTIDGGSLISRFIAIFSFGVQNAMAGISSTQLYTALLVICLTMVARKTYQWCKKRQSKRNKEEEQPKRPPPMLRRLPPGLKAKLPPQSLDWVRQTMLIDQEGDMAHEFLGPF